MHVGLNPDLPLKSSWPPLLHACENCQEAIIKLLLDKGANPNSSKGQLLVNKKKTVVVEFGNLYISGIP